MQTISQETMILRALKRAGRKGLTTWQMIQICPANYRARVVDLRNEGYTITSHRQYLPNGRYAGYFRFFLVDETEVVGD